VYRTPSGDFNHFSRLSDTALLSLNKPSTKILICGDCNVDYLSRCNHKQKLSLLLGAYNMMHTVDFQTRFRDGHSSAIENMFADKSRIWSYVMFPLSNAMSDHKPQCIICTKMLWKEAATLCGVRNGNYFQKIQITVCHTFKPAPTVISSHRHFCR